MRDAKVFQIVEGTSEIQRHVIVQYLRIVAQNLTSCLQRRQILACSVEAPCTGAAAAAAPVTRLRSTVSAAARRSCSWRSSGSRSPARRRGSPRASTVAGVDVGGLTPREARRVLERRAERGRAGAHRLHGRRRQLAIKPTQLGVEADWAGGGRDGRAARARASGPCAASSGSRRASSAPTSRRRCRSTPRRSTTARPPRRRRSTAATSRRSSSAAASRPRSCRARPGSGSTATRPAARSCARSPRFERGRRWRCPSPSTRSR